MPKFLAKIPKPTIGYVGTIAPYIDVALVRYLLENNSDKNFVFVGPFDSSTIREPWGDLARFSNFHIVDAVHWRQVPAIMQNLDICILPFLNNEWIRCSNSLKLGQYIAAGRPVITTPIEIPEEWVGSVVVAKTKEEFSMAIEPMLETTFDFEKATIQSSRVKKWDWDIKVKEYSRCIESVIEQKRSQTPVH
jgi:glycosyltransferase involved in cell wall biosynthesis